jgi:hypothetical protein
MRGLLLIAKAGCVVLSDEITANLQDAFNDSRCLKDSFETVGLGLCPLKEMQDGAFYPSDASKAWSLFENWDRQRYLELHEELSPNPDGSFDYSAFPSSKRARLLAGEVLSHDSDA